MANEMIAGTRILSTEDKLREKIIDLERQLSHAIEGLSMIESEESQNAIHEARSTLISLGMSHMVRADA